MNDLKLFADMDHLPGFRLLKVEIYNWGTFNSTVHSFHPRGQSALLVGENGTGKSTLVDALLTLLVRPNIRKYNFASGASKTERDERTYIQGAYDKTMNDSGTAKLEYLRPGNGHYSAILACFGNAKTSQTFTACQVLYLDSNNKPKKFYAFDGQKERGIAEDLGNITEGTSVLATLKKRGFQASEAYSQYFEWLRRAMNCRPKAMDMFNQDAFVKDVEHLDSFVRDQMLEKKPWDKKVAKLLEHFAELNEAHRTLLSIRDQAKLLEPIVERGKEFTEASEHLQAAKLQLEATTLYFKSATKKLLEPLCHEWEQRLTVLDGETKQVDEQIHESMQESAKIELQISGEGGERMQELPGLITRQNDLAEIKSKNRISFEALLKNSGIEESVDSADSLTALLKSVQARVVAETEQRSETQKQASRLQYELGQIKKQVSDDKDELASLLQRKGNMPRELVFLRDRLCQELKIPKKDLPFAAELIAVDSMYREWEASVENVLNSFARDLLVKEKYYAKVSGFVDRNRLVDDRGRGQRLSYTKVGQRVESNPSDSYSDRNQGKLTLPQMLNFRVENELAPWVRGQVQQRFNHLACDSVEQFQLANQKAMTKNRHTKRNRHHHNKDDRSQQGDRKWFILGWENREKISALKDTIESGEQQIVQLERREKQLLDAIEAATRTIGCLEQVSQTRDFDSLDEYRHRNQASQLKLELEKLSNSNDKIRSLKSKLAELEEKIKNDKIQLRTASDARTRTEDGLKNGRLQVTSCVQALKAAATDGSLERCEPQFEVIESLLEKTPVSLGNYMTLPADFQQDRLKEVQRLDERLVPVQKTLTTQMGKFLSRFRSYESDMGASVDSLPQFNALNEKIQKDDLPKHEERFKKRLNENVLTEVGVMNSHLENEHEEIKRKIEEINRGLLRMEWREGNELQERTHIRLEPEDTKDLEIRDFRRELADCLTGYLDGSNQANEETFLRIQKLVDKLRDEKNFRWRDKVIDVRRWFCFSAQEVVTETGETEGCSYYDGGSGKSGGEKARLAFLVLVAAIVYQYDINPDDATSNKFHFVMVDEMFSKTADKYARYALDLFKQFGLQLLMVAPLDAKARICEPYVGVHAHVVKDAKTNESEILSYTSEVLKEELASKK